MVRIIVQDTVDIHTGPMRHFELIQDVSFTALGQVGLQPSVCDPPVAGIAQASAIHVSEIRILRGECVGLEVLCVCDSGKREGLVCAAGVAYAASRRIMRRRRYLP